MISVEDIGEAIHVLLLNKDSYLNKTLSICGDKLTVGEMAAYMTKHSGVTFKERKVSLQLPNRNFSAYVVDSEHCRDWPRNLV